MGDEFVYDARRLDKLLDYQDNTEVYDKLAEIKHEKKKT